MDSLKILHILDHSLPYSSGYAFRTQNIFRAQLKRGWQPVGLTAPEHNTISKNRNAEEETVAGCLYYRTAALTNGTAPFFTQCRLITSLARRIREVAEIEKPDLLHVHSPVLNAIATSRVKRAMNIPLVYEIRAFWEDASVDHGMYAQDSWRYKLTHSLELWACHKANQVAVLCHGVKDKLTEQGIPPAKLSVVSNGVNLDDFDAHEPDPEYKNKWRLDGKQVIGFIGSFFRYEGLDLLVEAVGRLSANRSNIALLLVGGGNMETQLRQQVERLRLGEIVLMPGRIPHDHIPGVYALMDVLAYPRYSVRLTELVTPLKPLEAMAMGKAIVASDIGGHRELIQHGHTGLLFPPGNVSALAEALARLLDNVDLRRRYERQANAWVRANRSWDRTTAVYSEIYARALAR
jgi:PEP-CTERM/exosortase A-associated glycosyltransferase